ncbi:hypothetical protein QQ045_022542 [Rhodiola kirilowii]
MKEMQGERNSQRRSWQACREVREEGFANVRYRRERLGGETKSPIERRGGDFLRLRESLYSVFVDNIPVNRDERWVRALFNMVGRTMDVFIPARERKASRSRFGFVRYKSKGEAEAAIRRWNGANVGGAKLSVSLADDGGKPKARSRSGKSRLPGAGVGRREGGSQTAWKPTSVRNEAASNGGGKTKEFNREQKEFNRGQKQYRRRVRLEAFPEFEVWAQNTIVAEMKIIKLGEQIEREMRSEGIAFVKIVPTGGRNVLIQFANSEDLDKCLVEDYGAVLRNFSKMKRWRVDMLSTTRSVWISIIGLPFKAWSESNCERLAAPFGVCLKLDDRDVRFVGVGRARMLVETSCMERISELIEAEIEGKWYEIGICEECCLGGCEIDTPQSLEEEVVGKEGRVLVSSLIRNSGSRVSCRNEEEVQEKLCREKVSNGEKGGSDCSVSPLLGEEGTSVDRRMDYNGKRHSKGDEDDLSKFSNFEPDRRHSQVVPESDLQEEASRTSKQNSSSKEIVKTGGTEERETRRDSRKKAKEKIFVFSAKQGSGPDQNEKQLDKTNIDVSDQDDSLSLSEKYLNILKKERRKESKERKDIRYLRRKLLRAAVSEQLQGARSNLGIMPIVEASDAEEGKKSEKLRKEAENTFKIARRLGIKGDLPEEEMIQFYVNLHSEIS